MSRRQGVFAVRDGTVVAGRDPILVTVQLAGGLLELLRPCELPDGVYRFHGDGITRPASNADDEADVLDLFAS